MQSGASVRRALFFVRTGAGALDRTCVAVRAAGQALTVPGQCVPFLVAKGRYALGRMFVPVFRAIKVPVSNLYFLKFYFLVW